MILGIVKLWKSPGKAGGLPLINTTYPNILYSLNS